MKLINIAAILFIPLTIFVSCKAIEGERLVLAKTDQIYETTKVFPDKNPATGEPEAALVSMKEFPSVIQDAVNAFFGEEISELVLTDISFIKEDEQAKVFNLSPKVYGESGEVDLTWLQQLVPVIGGAIPGSAPVLGLLSYGIALFSRKRSRQHIGKAFEKFTPLNGSVKIKEGFNSLSKAIGLTHSSEDSETLFALAKKKQAEEEAALLEEMRRLEEQLAAKKAT